jgi:2'-5' RNA ligase
MQDSRVESSIDILIPSARSVVGEWYDLTESAADGMPPHITLLWPWLAAITDEALERLREATSRVTPFTVAFAGTGRFPGVLYLDPAPSAPLLELSRAIWLAFPEAPPYGGSLDHEPIPHLTVAKGERLDDVERQLRQRLEVPFEVLVDTISVSQAGAAGDGRWGVIADVELSP